jgi:hypothetical protein
MALSINIDGITFTLIRQYLDPDDGRNYVNIKSRDATSDATRDATRDATSESHNFWVYPSFSECGFWRLCYYADLTVKQLLKGPDYVQSSFIHLELQKFIYDNLTNVPVVSRPEAVSDKCLNPAVKSIINDSKRNIKFPVMSYFKCGIEPFITPDSLYVQRVVYNENMEKTFHLSESQVVMGYSNVFLNIISLTGHIYKCSLTSQNDPTQIFELYYYLCKFTQIQHEPTELITEDNIANIQKICEIPYHICPILLTIPDVKINRYGLYEKYSRMGVMVCKLFDYTKQCSLVKQINNDPEWVECNHIYSYIGYRYPKLFPYKEILSALEIPVVENPLEIPVVENPLEIPVVEEPLIIGSRRVNPRKPSHVFRFGEKPWGINFGDEPHTVHEPVGDEPDHEHKRPIKKGKVAPPGGGKKRKTKKTKRVRRPSRKYKKK